MKLHWFSGVFVCFLSPVNLGAFEILLATSLFLHKDINVIKIWFYLSKGNSCEAKSRVLLLHVGIQISDPLPSSVPLFCGL